MAYREDVDLEFLSKVSSQDLDSIVSLLTHDPEDGCERRTEELTKNEKYKRHYPDHNKYWELIAAEIQCFGANTLVTFFRGGKGVLYREILMDVCDNQSVNYNKKSDTRQIETQLLAKILEKSLEEMSPEELQNFARRLKLSPDYFAAGINVGIVTLLTKSGGFAGARVSSMLAAAAILPAVATVADLPLLIVTLTGPAYRVTVPICLLVTALRKKYELSSADILKMQKENELAQQYVEVINSYRSSDKKMMGLYIMALKALTLIPSGLTVEDIEDELFGQDRNSLERIKALMEQTPWKAQSFEDSIRYAITSCSCDKNALKVSLQTIMECSGCDIQDVSRLFQRFDDIAQQI